MARHSKAFEAGRADGEQWAYENPGEEGRSTSASPASDALVNGLSCEEREEVLGVRDFYDDDGTITDAAMRALSEYDRGWNVGIGAGREP